MSVRLINEGSVLGRRPSGTAEQSIASVLDYKAQERCRIVD